MRSFRSALALRVAVQALGVAVLVLVGATLFLRLYLISSLDASLLETAEVEAQTGATLASPDFHFRPRAFPAVSWESSDLLPWAQLLTVDGRPAALSANLTVPLSIPAQALREAQDGRVGVATHRWNGEQVRTVIYPMIRVSQAHRRHLLQVTASLAQVRTTIGHFIWLMGGLGLLGSALAWVAGWLIAGRAVKPALAMTAEAESISVNELGRRLAVPQDLAEFHRMALVFNALLDRLERAVTGTRRFTSDASHELRAPLTVLRGELELALTRPRSAGEYEEVLRRCLDEVLRLTRLADDLLTLTRIEGGAMGGKRAPVELEEVVERALEKKASLAASRGIELDLSGNAGLVSADADLLVRAVDALLEHAIMASPSGSRVRVRLSDGDRRAVEVTDSGSGIKQEDVSGIFQRFYRSNRRRVASDESGLGLPIARAVAMSHGGTLDYVGNDPGASFRLSLPAA